MIVNLSSVKSGGLTMPLSTFRSHRTSRHIVCMVCACLAVTVPLSPARAGGTSGGGGIIGNAGSGFVRKVGSDLLQLHKRVSEVTALPSRVGRAIAMGVPYWFGDYPDDLAHQQAAYKWGYEVADPEAVRLARQLGEAGQRIAYTIKDGVVVIAVGGQPNAQYQPLGEDTPGGFADSRMDIKLSVQGATDAAAGRPAKPPT